MTPSNYLAAFHGREAEIEENKVYHGEYGETFRASAYREAAGTVAAWEETIDIAQAAFF